MLGTIARVLLYQSASGLGRALCRWV